MRAASSPAAKRVKAKCVAAVIAAAMNFMMNSHHPHAWTTPVDVRTAGCAMAMFRRQTAAANSTIRKGSAVDPTRWRGASMPVVGLGRVGWPPVGFGARQQARRGPQAYCTVTALRIRSKSAYVCRVSLRLSALLLVLGESPAPRSTNKVSTWLFAAAPSRVLVCPARSANGLRVIQG